MRPRLSGMIPWLLSTPVRQLISKKHVFTLRHHEGNVPMAFFNR